MACLACVDACSQAFYKTFNPELACLEIVEKKSIRPMTCPQCGKCAEACPEGAITQNAKGVYMINKKKCTGCGKCAEACPNVLHAESVQTHARWTYLRLLKTKNAEHHRIRKTII